MPNEIRLDTHRIRSSSFLNLRYTGLPLSRSIDSSAVRRTASIAALLEDLPWSWVSSDIGNKECTAGEGPEKDTRPSRVFPTSAFCHITLTSKILLRVSLLCCLPFRFTAFSLRVLKYHIFCLASSMALGLDSSGLTSTAFLDARHFSSDVLHTPSTPQSQQFTQSTGLMMDRMRDACMTPDLSPAVSASTICASKTYIFFFFLEQLVLSSGPSAQSRFG